jgi:hypothetical protein
MGINLSARGLLQQLGPPLTLLIFTVWLLIVFRAMPVPTADFGMFVTVADRLRAGDRLYVDVFENKDPLAHYALALARFPSPLGAWGLHVAYLVLTCAGIYFICRRLGCGLRPSSLIAFAASPIVLTGAIFVAGTSHMIGIALCLWLIALRYQRYPSTVGVLIGILPFFKIVMLPLAILIVGYDLVTCRSSPKQLAKFAMGWVTSTGILLAILILRGELLPYISALQWNIGYSNALGQTSGLAGLLSRFTNVLTQPVVMILVVAITLCAVAWNLLQPHTSEIRDGERRRLFSLVLITSLGAFIIVAASGLWPHHAMVFMVPVSLCLVLFGASMFSSTVHRQFPRTLAVVMASVALSGLPGLSSYLTPIEFARANIGAHFRVSDEAKLILETGEPTTYARVGHGDEANHAYGLGDWKLECPFFAQFTWESTDVLNTTLECLPRAEVILVASGTERNTGKVAWDSYISAVDELLSREYSCRFSSGREVCKRL